MKRIIISILILITFIISGCEEIAPTQSFKPSDCPVCTCPEVEVEDVVDVYFIDVGQGDAHLIKSGNTEMLIDCGKNNAGPAIIDFLKSKDVTQLDYLLITHPDSDHLGGCDDVIKAIPTLTIIHNGETKDSQSYREVKDSITNQQYIMAQKYQEWSIGPAKMTVLGTHNQMSDSNQNSIVTRLVYGETEVLFTGDCDRDCEDFLLTQTISSDILKVTHHGSKYGTEIDFLEAVNPTLAIIPVGSNSYGHPTTEVLDRLNQESIITYRTDQRGTIWIKIKDTGYEVI